MRWRQDLEDGLEKTQARLFQRVAALEVVRLDLSFGIGQGHLCHHGVSGRSVATGSARRPGVGKSSTWRSGKLEPLACDNGAISTVRGRRAGSPTTNGEDAGPAGNVDVPAGPCRLLPARYCIWTSDCRAVDVVLTTLVSAW